MSNQYHDAAKMDLNNLNKSLQALKDQLKHLMAASAELIERNSEIDSGQTNHVRMTNNSTPAPKFETLLEDFLSSCNMIELNLRTMQESLSQGKASLQNLPITVSPMKADKFDSKPESVEPNTTVSYNQYLSAIRYQVDTAKSIRSILEEFVNQQNNQQLRQRNNQLQHMTE